MALDDAMRADPVRQGVPVRSLNVAGNDCEK